MDVKSESAKINSEQRSINILIMDDDENIRKLLEKLLDLLGYRSKSTKNRKETIDLFQSSYKNGNPFDLVILDMVIHGNEIEGFETLSDLKKINPNIRVILSSGNIIDYNTTKFSKKDFDGILPKPYNLSELDKCILNTLNF